MSKSTMVSLKCKSLGLTQQFEIDHAERLLSLRNNGGWELDDPSAKYTEKNGIELTGNRGKSLREKEAEHDKQSD